MYLHQTTGTEALTKSITYLLNYCATHPEATLEYKPSDIILYIHSGASYVSVLEGKISIGGFFFLGNKPQDPKKTTTVLSDSNVPLYV